MILKSKNVLYHLLALATIVVWGISFISTKVLLAAGMSPADIMFYRFLMAYIGLWLISPGLRFPKNRKDELLFLLAGFSGGSFYFITENTALQYTLASNVALILAATPLLTLLLSRWVLKTAPLQKTTIGGSVFALAGVAFVVFNGNFVLKLNPIGDILTLLSALSWAVYCITLKMLDTRYGTVYITRKVFFYGLLTMMPYFFFRPLTFDWTTLKQPAIAGNLLFLGIIASLGCFLIWNRSVLKLGTVVTSNYLYLVPLVTMIASAAVLKEPVTWLSVCGAGMIIGGVYFAQNGLNLPKRNDKSHMT